MTILLPRLQKEIGQYKIHAPSPTIAEADAEDFANLESLIKLCGEDQYLPVNRKWHDVENDFSEIPIQLKRILFGLKESKKTHLSIWEKYAKPYLKSEVDHDKNKNAIFELLQFRKRNSIGIADINQLIPSTGMLDKKAAIEKMKELLRSVKATNSSQDNQKLAREFERLADQFVFLNAEKNQRDSSKNKALKTIVSQRLIRITSFEFSEATFKGEDGAPTEYGRLIESYSTLKSQSIPVQIQEMKKKLQEIQQSLPQKEIDASNLKDLANFSRKKQPNPVNEFKKKFKDLQKENKFILFPDIKDFDTKLKNLKLFPYGMIQANQDDVESLIKKLNGYRQYCLEYYKVLNNYLDQIQPDEVNIKSRVESILNALIDAFNQNNTEEVKEIFRTFAFVGDLDALRQKVVNLLQMEPEEDLEDKIDRLVCESESELSTSFVVGALRESNLQKDISLLKTIYINGLSKDDRDLQIAWINIERKSQGKQLSAEKMREVESWLPPINKTVESNQIREELHEYLNGTKRFELGASSRFEHPSKKLGYFEDFLEKKCFPAFPELRDKKGVLISYFKIANGIFDRKNVACHFVKTFGKKINNLGRVFSKILEREGKGASPQEMKLWFLAAEYDLQDVGELAKLITERPSLWNQGRHMLSSPHLLSISLMRKMMAHYPLLLQPHIIRWNLEYLAFDANNLLSQNPGSYIVETTEMSQRKPITVNQLQDKLFDILHHLDHLNLSTELDVLYPTLQTGEQAFLHPFGEFALMVYPGPKPESQQQFVHALMELELILNYELETKICILGNWDKKVLNIPSEQHIPQNELITLLEGKQNIHDWIFSRRLYESFKNNPWSEISYKSGFEVTRSDYELYHGLVSFLRVIEIDRNNLKAILERDNLENRLLGILRTQLENAQKASKPT